MPKNVTIHATLLALTCTLPVAAYAFADAPKQVDIPAGDLSRALLQLSKQYGADLVYRPEQVHGLTTHGAHGALTTEQAATRLLEGTRLELRTDPSGAMLIAPPGANTDSAANESRGKGPDAATAGAKEGKSAPADGFRVAQVDRGTVPGAGSVEKNNSADSQKQPVQLEEIVVTGSHIRGSVAASPVLQIDQAYIQQSGLADTGDLIRSLPQNWTGGQNPGTIGAPGALGNPSYASSANLRGLGADATLTLVNGHRLAYDGYQNNVDVSIVPLAAIQRIDVLTDGASAVYGSDAIAGVMNFMLRKDYDGAELTARLGAATQGGAFQQQYSALVGKKWSTGNFILSYEHAGDDGLDTAQRSDLSDVSQGATSLLPVARRDSLFAAGNQSINEVLSTFIQALYTSRSTSSGVGYAPFDVELSSNINVQQYGVTGGADLALPGGWSDSTSIDYSSTVDKDRSRESFISTGLLGYDDVGYYKNRMLAVETAANGPLLTLPTGEVAGAIGGGYRREEFQEVVSSTLRADRGVAYGYGELNIPLVAQDQTRTGLERLELNFAVRHEHYSDFGGTTNPKVGLAYYPVAYLKLRGTWGSSFRAPSLDNEHAAQQLSLYPPATLHAPAGAGPILFHSGANPNLGPETARSWTTGFDYTPVYLAGFKAAVTYYNIDYTDRIVQPFPSFVNIFNNPYSAPFIVYSPGEALQRSILSMVPSFSNFAGVPYDPATVYALLQNQLQNAESQQVSGVDLNLDYVVPVGAGTLDLSAAASWLRLKQEFLAGAPYETLNGTVFNPPSERYRAGLTWKIQGLSATAIVNYVGGSTNDVITPSAKVGSWTTVDTTLSYSFAPAREVWGGLKLMVAVQNLFDREPPRISWGSTSPTGIGFDATNTAALGRLVSVALSKSW